MSDFTLNLTPSFRNPNTEGYMDTSIDANGNSVQRTGYIEVFNNSDRKIMIINDGTTFDDEIDLLYTTEGE